MSFTDPSAASTASNSEENLTNHTTRSKSRRWTSSKVQFVSLCRMPTEFVACQATWCHLVAV